MCALSWSVYCKFVYLNKRDFSRERKKNSCYPWLIVIMFVGVGMCVGGDNEGGSCRGRGRDDVTS